MKKFVRIILALTLIFTFSATSILAQDADGLLFSFSYAEKNNGIVDKKNTATLEKVSDNGREVLKIVPAGAKSDDSQLRIDCYKLSYPVSEFSNVRYMTVEYKYECPEQYENIGKMHVILSRGGGALTSNVTADSVSAVECGGWKVAIFDVSAITEKLNMTEGNIFKQFHFYPYGKKTDSKTLSASQIMYIGDISFYSFNPNNTEEYSVTFKSSQPDADGNDPAELTVKRGDKYILPENPYTLENAEFLGWKYSLDEKLYAPGTEITAADDNVIFMAEFKITEPDICALFIRNRCFNA